MSQIKKPFMHPWIWGVLAVLVFALMAYEWGR